MARLRFSRNQPGLFVSAIAHAGLLAATLIVFADAKKFEDAQEYVPVEILTDQQFNQITKGEAAAQVAPPALRVDKVAATDETKPQPPLAEAKRDIAAPPPPLKGLRDAEDENQPAPPKRQAALSQPEAQTAPA
ncbi:MAG: cell envelope biogenesis protein TolA, partial [Methylocystis sp.]|nr:cell envelope biogenesis protein TolA [Methylocystis sp.]